MYLEICVQRGKLTPYFTAFLKSIESSIFTKSGDLFPPRPPHINYMFIQIHMKRVKIKNITPPYKDFTMGLPLSVSEYVGGAGGGSDEGW